MGLGDVIAFAVGALRGHRLRTALSVAGVAIGIAAVVALTALGEGARGYVVREFMSLGSNLLIVLPGKVETTGGMPYGGTTHDLTLDDLRELARRVPRAMRVAPIATGTETVRYGSRGRSVPVIGSTAELLEVRRLEVASGRFLASGDPEAGGSEVVLGVEVASELFGNSNPLGEVVRIGDWRYRVVGVLAPHGRSFVGFNFDDLVVIPVRTAMRMFDRTSLFRILLEMESPDDLESGKRAVLELMRERHRVDDVTVITQDAVVETFSSILGVLTLVLVAVASISLSVAGIGIMNVMLVAVAERRREIGLLRAVGAGTGQILAVFLTEAAVLAAAGGVVGLLAGWAAVRAFVRVYPSFPAATPAWAVAAALAVAVGVGVVFGTLPARRAARLEPVRALQGR